jgi:hypothetical protein
MINLLALLNLKGQLVEESLRGIMFKELLELNSNSHRILMNRLLLFPQEVIGISLKAIFHSLQG